MAGHSKWAQIKRQKGATDQKKGALFTKLGHAIALAVRKGGNPDPAMNLQLRLAIDKAKSMNMPGTTIDRAIKRASGEGEDAGTIQEALYEGYAPGGIALLIEAATDNRNRTSSSLKHILGAHGGKLGESNSVRWMFERKGVLVVTPKQDRETQDLALIDAGAEELKRTDGGVILHLTPGQLLSVKDRLETAGEDVVYAQIDFVPTTTVTRLDNQDAKQLTALEEALDEDPDVTEVTTNYAEDE